MCESRCILPIIPQLAPLPHQFFTTLRTLNRHLNLFYQRLVPVLRRRFRDNTLHHLDEIKLLIEKAEEHLAMTSEVREISERMAPLLEPMEVVLLQELIDVMGVWEEEFEEALEYLRDVLGRCGLVLDGLRLED